MVRHVAPRPTRRIELRGPPDQVAHNVQTAGPGGDGIDFGIAQKQLEQIVDAAALHAERAPHVALAQGQLRIEHQMPLDAALFNAHDDRRPGSVAIPMR
jgi:hypothetical protein